jgi:chemosensory pili system protein ChpA (sensor histidine kinase/response regulator)
MLSEQQQRILGYFIEEAKDHLNTIEQGLLNLQNTIEDPEMVSEVFRAAHSVKGGAAMLGLDCIQQTAHKLEDYFKVLKECPVKVDQKLETLFLRIFDTLQELLEQLQGPFGLTDDKVNEVMAEAQPVFGSLQEHLSLLVTQCGSVPPDDVDLTTLQPPIAASSAPVAAKSAPVNREESALQLIFQSDVPAQLREMLKLFKLSDQPKIRQQLQDICLSMARIGEQFDLPAWCALLETARRAIANTDNTYRTLAPIVIKEIKQAQELVLAGRSSEIAASIDLSSLAPATPVDEFHPDFAELLTPGLVNEAEMPELFDLSSELDLSQSLPPDLNPAVEAITAATDIDAASASEDGFSDVELRFDAEPTHNLEPYSEAIDFAALEPPTAPSSHPDGPEVGIAELNSLADLFEGEVPDLGMGWQEEIIDDPAASLSESLDLSESNDFSDLLFDQDSSTTAIDPEDDDLSGLLNRSELANDMNLSQAASISAAEALSDLLPSDFLPIDPPDSDESDFAEFFMTEAIEIVDATPSQDTTATDSDLENLNALFGSLDEEVTPFSADDQTDGTPLDDLVALGALFGEESDSLFDENLDLEAAQTADTPITELQPELAIDSEQNDFPLGWQAESAEPDFTNDPFQSTAAAADVADSLEPDAADLLDAALINDFADQAEAVSIELEWHDPEPVHEAPQTIAADDLWRDTDVTSDLWDSVDRDAVPPLATSDLTLDQIADDALLESNNELFESNNNLFADAADLEETAAILNLDEPADPAVDRAFDTLFDPTDELFGTDDLFGIEADLNEEQPQATEAEALDSINDAINDPTDSPGDWNLTEAFDDASPDIDASTAAPRLFDDQVFDDQVLSDQIFGDQDLMPAEPTIDDNRELDVDLGDLFDDAGASALNSDWIGAPEQPAANQPDLFDAEAFGFAAPEASDLSRSLEEFDAAAVDADFLLSLSLDALADAAPAHETGTDNETVTAHESAETGSEGTEITTDADLLHFDVPDDVGADFFADGFAEDDAGDDAGDDSSFDLALDNLPTSEQIAAEPLDFDADFAAVLGETASTDSSSELDLNALDLDALTAEPAQNVLDLDSLDLEVLGEESENPASAIDEMAAASMAAQDAEPEALLDLFEESPADAAPEADLDALLTANAADLFESEIFGAADLANLADQNGFAAEEETSELFAAELTSTDDEASEDFGDLDALFNIDETAADSSITRTGAIDPDELGLTTDDLAQFDALLNATTPTEANFGSLDDLDALLNDDMNTQEAGVDAVAADSHDAAGFDEFESLLDGAEPSSEAAATPAATAASIDDFANLDALLDEAASSAEAADAGDAIEPPAEILADSPDRDPNALLDQVGEFADLEALLDEDITFSSISGFNEDIEDDFSDLEALLGDEPAVTSPAPFGGHEFDDLEKLLEKADQTLGGTPTTRSARRSSLTPKKRSPGALNDQTMRVSVKNLDNLNNLVGELVVNRNSLEQAQERLRQFLDNLLYQVQQLSDVGQRMRDLYERSLLESSLLSSRRSYHLSSQGGSGSTQSNHSTGASFDALEMDRFTGFHTLSQEMIELIVRVRESASDIDFVVDESDQITRMFRQVTTQLQEGLNRSRMVPFDQTAARLPRAVRDISVKYGKQADLAIEGKETLIDKMILEQLYDPMTHLVNNAITHGIETPEERRAAGKPAAGRITVRAYHQGNQTVISVTDDGAGIDPEKVKRKAIEKGLITSAEAKAMTRLDVYDLLFHHGFSTKDRADDFAGRGVGMDVVRTSLNEIRGSINIDSTIGKGTTFTIRLPLTLSISKALCCISNRARIAFPMDGVEDMLDVPQERIQTDAGGRACIQWRDTLLPFQPLSELLKYNRSLGRGSVYGGNQEEDIVSVVVLRSNAGNFLALQVDQVLGEQEIVIKQLEGPAPKPVGVAGATVLGDGRIMPIADVLELIDLSMGRIRREPSASLWEKSEDQPPAEPAVVKSDPTVLIVDDSITVRELLSMTFNKVGYRVEQARDGQEAWEKLRSGLPCDLVFCDIEMPRMDGLELLSRIQKDANLSHLPIAMLTSRGADRHRQMAVQLGAKGYFTKPYLEEALLDAAQRMLRGEVLVGNS